MKSGKYSKTKNLEETAGVTPRALLLAVLLAVLTIAALWFLIGWAYPGGYAGCGIRSVGMMGAAPYVSLAIGLNLLSILLLIYLIAQYIRMYEQLRSEFTLGLIIIAYVLLAHSLMSNPLLFSSPLSYGLMSGSLSILPALFTTIAAGVLLYLNAK